MGVEITREITQAGASTTRGYFGCIFKGITDYATWLWCAFYVRLRICV
jgi:hypothetical protein